MNYSVTNLDTKDIMVGSVLFKAQTTKTIPSSYVKEEWKVFGALIDAGLLSMVPSGDDPSQVDDSSADHGTSYDRLVVKFTDHSDEYIEVNHGRGKFPIIQVVEQIGDEATLLLPDLENTEAGYTISGHIVDVVHVDRNITRIFTDATDGFIILLW